MANDTASFYVRLPKDKHRQLKKLCIDMDVSMNRLAEKLLIDFIFEVEVSGLPKISKKREVK